MSAMAFESSTLSWVKDEIDLALERAGDALARHAAAPAQTATLDEALGHLHQAGGALILVGLAGVSHCVTALETQLEALRASTSATGIADSAADSATSSTTDPAADRAVAVSAAAGALILALRRYLDDLLAGQPDQPLRLLPAYRALRLAAGATVIDPLPLFQPDLGILPPRRDATGTTGTIGTTATIATIAPTRFKALRLGFARGLAKWRSGEPRGLVEMKNALAILDASLVEPAARRLWWVALGWFDTVDAAAANNAHGQRSPADDGTSSPCVFHANETDNDAATSTLTLLTALDRQLGDLAESVSASVDEVLLKRLLYAIALAPAGTAQLESVRAAYRLADQMPAASGSETHRAACRAPLTTAMTEWEALSAGQAIALMRFHDVMRLLSATAHDSHDEVLAELVDAAAAFAAWLRQQPEQVSPARVLEMAGALLLVEDAIEIEGARSPGDGAMFAQAVADQVARLERLQQSGAPAMPLPAAQLPWRVRQLEAQVAQEIRISLDALEAQLTPAFESAAPLADNATALHTLHQIAGAFILLGSPHTRQAASLVATCRTLLAANDSAHYPAIAERLAALANYADTLSGGRPAEDALAALAAFVDLAAQNTHASVTAVLPTAEAATSDLVAAANATAAVSAVSTTTAAAATADDADAEMLAIFLEEAQEVLATLADALPALAAQPGDRTQLTTVRRGFHTLKGSGRMVGLAALGDTAHAVERVFNRCLDERAAADAELLAIAETARCLFIDWASALADGRPPPDGAALIARCQARPGETAVLPAPTFTAAATPTPAPVPLTAPVTETAVRIGTLSVSPTLFGLYVEEAGTHVATLRSELSDNAGIPSRELIRAAHTLAGISAGTGFPSVQVLAHALENALVRHSLAHAVPDENARMLFARAAGALQGMVGAIAERRAPAEEPALAAALEACQPALPAAVPTAAATPTPAVNPLAERRQSRPADEIDAQLAPLFLEEADEALHQLDADLRAWRAAPQDVAIGRRLARQLHTFKGGARMCGAMGIGELAHSMENRIEQAIAAGGAGPDVLDGLDTSLGRAQSLVQEVAASLASHLATPASATPDLPPASTLPPPPSPATDSDSGSAVLLRVRADLIDRLVSEAGELAITRGRIDGGLKAIKGGLLDLTDNIARLRSQLREFELHAETSMQSQLGAQTGGKLQDGSGRPQGGDQPAGPHVDPRFDPLEFDRFTRLQELTRMMAETVGDVATVQHSLLRQADAAGEALAIQSRQQRELSHALLRARMVPFATVAERLHRVVRQTAKELGRQANLDLRGGDAPVDRHVLERMLGPLEHLLRNAVAHGIEPPAARRAAGKPELGQIALTIVAGDNDIVLQLDDDGQGLDFAAIHARALAQGLLDTSVQPDDSELAELIFRAGFSTAAAVSEIAGRGVGLDVVRDEVTQLGGQVSVNSCGRGHDADRPPGEAVASVGTHFKIVLPLTLAVIPVMLVDAGGQRWAIPAAMIEEVRELDAAEAAARQAAGGLTRNGQRYPWHTLPQLFSLPVANADTKSDTRAGWQLLLRHGGRRIALAVDALAQNQEVVVKPLGAQLKRVPGLSGATVLPDGRIALIINPLLLLDHVWPSGQPGHGTPLNHPAVPPAPTFPRPACVMVVDDSLTVRKITGRLLERAGYRVVTAKDGEDALAQIRANRPDILLADIEMPRMDGFALVAALRDDAQTAALGDDALVDLPVIMITSRIADKHRQVAQALGVKHYLGKPYDEDELLGLIAAELR